MDKLKEIFNSINTYLSEYGFVAKIVYALALLIIGWLTVNLIVNLIGKLLKKRNFDETLLPFIKSLVLWLLRVALLISVAGIVGIETASFIAILGAVGFAIGMAMQGALGNLAGGALILIFRPYKVGDLIESQGRLGVVKEIQIFTTILLSPENKTIILPNGPVANNDIVNYTVEGVIRVDCSVGIAYHEDIAKAKEVLMKVLESDEDVLKTPAPFVGVSELAGSSIDLAVRGYAKPAKYWDVFFRVNENMKIALDKAGIEIPFSQMDVTIKK
ncbi:MAG: mechanosensitive ion channel [Bacteroidetes bacterium]|nr:mechanosensitive ion channel [Bacteroidota bacterium]MCB9225989.1 mechanosensitive ion channel [Chitinophagales bacterium]